MGWSNFIIVHKLKILIETNRDVEDIETYRKESLDKILDEENIDDDVYLGIGDIKVSNIKIKDLTLLYKDHEVLQCIRGTHIDKLLLYWLKSRGIDFEVKSEYNIDKDKYKSEGYTIIER